MKKTTCLFALLISFPAPFCAAQAATTTTNNPTIHAWGAPADDLAALKDPKQIVKLRFREPNFEDLAKNFTEADLPAFYDILNNDDTPFREKSIAIDLIPYICKKGDSRVVAKLVNFLRGPVKWKNWATNAQDTVKVVLTKNNSIQSIRIVGGSQAEEVLTQAITAAGAEDLAKAWISGWPSANPYGNREDILGGLRGAAAYQLASIKTHWDLIQAEYARERQACIDSGKRSHYISGLMSAMALIDAIKEVGTLPDPRLPSLILQYTKKYQLPTAASEAH